MFLVLNLNSFSRLRVSRGLSLLKHYTETAGGLENTRYRTYRLFVFDIQQKGKSFVFLYSWAHTFHVHSLSVFMFDKILQGRGEKCERKTWKRLKLNKSFTEEVEIMYDCSFHGSFNVCTKNEWLGETSKKLIHNPPFLVLIFNDKILTVECL